MNVVFLTELQDGRVRVDGPTGVPLTTTRRMAEILADGYQSNGYQIIRTSVWKLNQGEWDR